MTSKDEGVLSIISQITDNSDQVWKHLVWPFKHNYSSESLGPDVQMWGKSTYFRKDSFFKNSRGNQLEYTLYRCEESFSSDYFIVYLHSHSGWRLEGYHMLRYWGQFGINIWVIDLPASGHSEGEFISMGYHEKEDLWQLLKILQTEHHIRSFAVWGRSLGASIALMAYPKMQGVFWLILDSPFTSVKKVYRNAVWQVINLPNLMIDMIFKFACSEVESRYKVDLTTIQPFENGKLIRIPSVLIGTKNDLITEFSDLQSLYKEIKVSENEKVLWVSQGSHNDDRDEKILIDIMQFINNIYKNSVHNNQKAKEESLNGSGIKTDIEKDNLQNKLIGTMSSGVDVSKRLQFRRNSRDEMHGGMGLKSNSYIYSRNKNTSFIDRNEKADYNVNRRIEDRGWDRLLIHRGERDFTADEIATRLNIKKNTSSFIGERERTPIGKRSERSNRLKENRSLTREFELYSFENPKKFVFQFEGNNSNLNHSRNNSQQRSFATINKPNRFIDFDGDCNSTQFYSPNIPNYKNTKVNQVQNNLVPTPKAPYEDEERNRRIIHSSSKNSYRPLVGNNLLSTKQPEENKTYKPLLSGIKKQQETNNYYKRNGGQALGQQQVVANQGGYIGSQVNGINFIESKAMAQLITSTKPESNYYAHHGGVQGLGGQLERHQHY